MANIKQITEAAGVSVTSIERLQYARNMNAVHSRILHPGLPTVTEEFRFRLIERDTV
ncbi:hypothetical protein [Fontibacillus phaseoli]|uniref:hypothetical protein n=1 Tax=Fontibacillus phaseoli TaxID=1416533 RepID=UPI0015F03A2D|nr:hypothetical protein [Fontibacillus phaseoli]